MVDAVFDTDILIDHLRNVRAATALISSVRDRRIIGYISTITEAELYAGKDEENEDKNLKMAELLDLFEKIEVSSTIAKSAGRIKRRYGVAITDAIIGATALTLNCKLLTRNARDFSAIKEIVAEDPY